MTTQSPIVKSLFAPPHMEHEPCHLTSRMFRIVIEREAIRWSGLVLVKMENGGARQDMAAGLSTGKCRLLGNGDSSVLSAIQMHEDVLS